jgi:transposase
MEPNEVIEYGVTQCECCGEDLSSHPQHEAGRRQQIDIPQIKLIVRDIVRYGCYCPACDTYQRAEVPPEHQTCGMFGPNLEQLVLYLHYAHPLSYERVQRILADQYGISLGIGTLVNIVNRAQARLESAAARIREQVQQADVIGSDETGARVDGINQWQWVFQTPELAYFTIVPSRASEVILDVLDDAKPQVWISDLLSSQMCHPAEAYQLCLAHQVRDLQYVIDQHSCSWASDVQTLFYDAMSLTQNRHADDFQRQARDLQQRLDRLLKTYPVNEDSQRLWRRYHKHHDALLILYLWVC